jgi:hypothetical protein
VFSIRLAAVTLLFAVLAGCGGGGGGGGNHNDDLRFTLDRSSLAFDFEERQSVPTQTVTATATGSLPGTVFVGVIVEGVGLDTFVPTTISGNRGTFEFRPRADLTAGDYTGRALLLACSDPQCNTRLGNTPLAVPYTVHVKPTLRVSPTNTTLSAVSGNEGTAVFTIQLPFDQTTSNAQLTQGADFFSIENATATGFEVVGRSMPSGQYLGQVRIDSGSRTAFTSFTYNVTPPPGGDRDLSASPLSLTLTATEGAHSAPEPLTVTPASWDSRHSTQFEYFGSATGWLSTTSVSGGYEVVADATSLTEGTYNARILIGGPSPVNTVQVSVALTVGVGLVRPADLLKTITSETTQPQLSGSEPVTVAGGPAINWTASSDQPWLVLTRAAGATGSNLNYTIDATSLSSLANGAEHVAEVTIDPEPSTMTPVTFAVHVDKHLAEITGLGPYLQVSDRNVRVIVRGLGFDAITNPAARIDVAGVAGETVQRRGDTELLITTAAPQAAGTYLVSASNALNLPVANRSLVVVDPITQLAASSTTGGDGETVIYDAERNTVYFANTGLQAVQRFTNSGGNWILHSVPVAGINDIGMSNDGADLVVLSANAAVRLLDTNSALAQRDQIDHPELLGGNSFGIGLRTTNDGRVWFSPSHSSIEAEKLLYFDPGARTFGTIAPPPPPPLSHIVGPNYAGSRDGSRLVINQNNCCTPRVPVLYMDAVDSVLHVNPANLEGFGWAHASDDGDRLLLDLTDVYDRNFELIGNTTRLADQMDQGHLFAVAGVVSPDGNRIYLVTYHDSEISQFPPPVPTLLPRVYVFDSSTRMVNTTKLPLLGYFLLAEFPTTRVEQGNYRPGATISPDGRTLFVAGGEKLLVVPLPAEGSLTPPQ